MSIDNPELYEEAKQIADATYKKPSAYKSGFIVKKYKELGGTYSGKKENKGINRWKKEEWKDVGKKDYPVYRPTKRITKDTPLTVQEISPSNLKKQIDLKQIIKGDANLPPFLSELKKQLQGGNFAEDGKNLKSIFGRVGSKMSLIKDIIPLIPPHTTYVEPFIGGGSLFWNKDPSTKSVINDLDKELVNAYRNLKKASITELKKMDYLDTQPFSDEDVKLKTPEYLKDINKLMVNLNKINSKSPPANQVLKYFKISRGTFNSIGVGKIYRNVLFKPYIANMDEYKQIINNTTILNKNYIDVIKEYDSPTTFFLLDPPYEKSDTLYKNDTIDYEEMNNVLKNIKGKFILTINDSKYISDVFKGFNQKKVSVSNASNAISFVTKGRKELFISNYNMKKGGSVETNRFDENGTVSLPEFRSVNINLPTYMYKRLPDIDGKPPAYRYRLVIPITSSRNLSSRLKETSLIINQKPVSRPTFDIIDSIEGQVEPRLDQFSPADRRKIQTYYNKVKENERRNPDEIDKDDYEIIPRGRPLPCDGPKKSKNLGKEVKILSKEPKKLGKKSKKVDFIIEEDKEGSFLDNLQKELNDKPKQRGRPKKPKKVEEPKEDLFKKLMENPDYDEYDEEPSEKKAGFTKEQIISRMEKLEKEIDVLYRKIEKSQDEYIRENPKKYKNINKNDIFWRTGIPSKLTDEEGKRYNELRDEIDDLNNQLIRIEVYGKGLLSKNKILSNNKKMANPWIEYVKSYAAKNGMSYRDALRCPKCKAGYKKGGRICKVGMGVVDEIGNQDLLAEMYNDSELGANAGKKYISL